MESDKRSTAEASCEGSTRCDGCKSCGAILELDGCGHRFHPRCIFSWPATRCELCAAPVTTLRVFREFKNLQNSGVRKGKWSADEHKYANMMMKQFQLGALPLADGLHLRGFIANLLQCDPLRVTKKYAGQAIGKQNFFYQHRKTYCYNLHIKLQKRVSSLRNHFYWHIQYRCKFGYQMNIKELKAAEADYWIREFRKFAAKIGQKVEFSAPAVVESPTSDPHSGKAASQHALQGDLTSPSADLVVKTTPVPVVESPASPMVVSLASSEPQVKVEVPTASETSIGKVFSLVDATAPSMKEGPSLVFDCPSMERSLSPLSFDEWSDPSSIMAMAFADLSQGELSVTAAMETTVAMPVLDTAGKKKRGSLGEWIREVDLEWSKSKGVPSWSFSLSEPLSDCA
ncbi:hypothetical protein BBJ28_00004614 [Nothophytophthora sp. Chile5]|nr:hypothetical protein BBJ28_00004614 [Nothophytophthora sp. Chile5]